MIVALVVSLALALGPEASGDARPYAGTAETPWPVTDEVAAAAPEDDAPAPDDDAAEGDAPKRAPVPPPRAPKIQRIAVAVGLAPEAPGSKAERALLDTLERSAAASPDPNATVRRLRPGVGDGRSICRDRRDDLVILVGYTPQREEAVLLPYDCRLDAALMVRSAAAAREPGLVGALWDEREALVRQGMKERRVLARLSPKVRAGIIAGVAIVVIGTAVGLLVANALRDQRVVLKVSP